MIKLFNAVKAAQTKSEEGNKAVKGEGVVRIKKRRRNAWYVPRIWTLGSGKIQRNAVLRAMSK